MRVGLIAFAVFMWIVMMTCTCIMAGQQIGSYEEGVLQSLTGWQNISSTQNSGTFVVRILAFVPSFFSNLYNVITFQSTLFSGNPVGQIIQWFAFAPITVVLIYGIVMTMILVFRYLLG